VLEGTTDVELHIVVEESSISEELQSIEVATRLRH
jgi:hypothetical protein